MGRTCKICLRSRANEKFGGRGLRRVICKDCRKLPKSEITRILTTDDVYQFLDQSNISQKNIARLESLTWIEDESFQRLRTLVLEIARVKPGKKRRWKVLRQQHPDLYKRIIASQLFDHILDEYYSNSFDEYGSDEYEMEQYELEYYGNHAQDQDEDEPFDDVPF